MRQRQLSPLTCLCTTVLLNKRRLSLICCLPEPTLAVCAGLSYSNYQPESLFFKILLAINVTVNKKKEYKCWFWSYFCFCIKPYGYTIILVELLVLVSLKSVDLHLHVPHLTWKSHNTVKGLKDLIKSLSPVTMSYSLPFGTRGGAGWVTRGAFRCRVSLVLCCQGEDFRGLEGRYSLGALWARHPQGLGGGASVDFAVLKTVRKHHNLLIHFYFQTDLCNDWIH